MPHFDRAVRLMQPARVLTAPKLLGLERVPASGPRLFVGNHTLLGLLDAPWFVSEMYRRKGITLHALADHAHFAVPGWRQLLGWYGAVDGTRDNLARLFAEGADVLVFPGGAREVMKNPGERYQLKWGTRRGFAHMAIAHGVPIVPFAAIGVEDALDVVVGPDAILASPVGSVLRTAGVRDDLVMPVVRGVGPTPIPRPERLYFEVLDPIDPGDDGSEDAVWALRERVRVAIEDGIDHLFEVRRDDPNRRLRDRVRRTLSACGPSARS